MRTTPYFSLVTNIFLCWFLCLGAQKNYAQESCGNTLLMQHLANDPAYIQSLAETDERILNYSATARGNDDSILVIPVVFHILHTGENIGTGSNISNARILAALNTTNREWNDATDRGANMAISFCLANTDPDGNPTSGIVRIDASGIPEYEEYGVKYDTDQGGDEGALKQLSNWPHDKYYNIWVVNKIAGGWAGFAYYPTANNFFLDGTIIAASSVASNNKVLAHELGHGLALYHTFEGGDDQCPPNTNCATQGDRICDTPPHKKLDCAATNCSDSPELFLSTYNIMSYCSLTRKFYTEGQKTRSRNAIFTTSRASLLTSGVCAECETTTLDLQLTTCDSDSVMTVVDTTTTVFGCELIVTINYTYLPVPEAAFTYSIDAGSIVNFELQSEVDDSTAVQWQFGDGSISDEEDPSHEYLAPGTYEVTLILSNKCGIDSFSTDVTILPTGIRDDLSSPLAKIFPNPNPGNFTLDMIVKAGDNYQLKVLNPLGQVIRVRELQVGKEHDIYLGQDLPEGIYFLHIFSNKQSMKVLPLTIKRGR